jgi:hypothetical protein
MTQASIQKKLRLQPGHRALVINSPRAYSGILGTVGEGVRFVEAQSSDVDFVHLFVRNQADLDRYFDAALKSIKYDGLFWISYPKGSSKVETDLNRDILWELLKEKGIRPVTQVSIDETWSAMRFRPREKVGK